MPRRSHTVLDGSRQSVWGMSGTRSWPVWVLLRSLDGIPLVAGGEQMLLVESTSFPTSFSPAFSERVPQSLAGLYLGKSM